MVARTKKSPAQKTPKPKQFKCEDCDYIGGSKSVVTRHWNKVHRKPHAQKRGTRKRNQDQGRPSSLTPVVIANLVAAFQNGLTKQQAFRYAGISKDVYYKAMKADEEFAEKMRVAQEHLNFRAREVVARSIDGGDVRTAQWWLERKQKDEFSQRKETTGSGGGSVKLDVNKPKSISLEELHEAVLGSV